MRDFPQLASDDARDNAASLVLARPGSHAVAKSVGEELEHFRQRCRLPRKDLSPPVQRLVHVIHEHLFDHRLNVKTLKAQCRLRDNNVSCRFKCEAGVYLHDYIAQRRLEAAVLLLHRPELSIAEVAYHTGYAHLQTFYRRFRERFSCTPAEFREQACVLTGPAPSAADRSR